MEVRADGNQAAAILFEIGWNPPSIEKKLKLGLRVILYDHEERCEGLLRHGEIYDWVADLIPGTWKELTPADFEQLSAETRRAAEEID